MKQYDPKKIEAKWQKFWDEHQTFQAPDDSDQPKKYVLVEFPYPSGEGLHMGHLRPYVAGDVYSRYWRLRGQDVMYPMGWDAFGLPAENFAIKHGVHPSVSTAKNIANAKRQIKSWGLGFDWSREVNTTDPHYYKWTQWIFLQLYKAGLAYEATGLINWCPKDKTGLANEEVIDGKCERCGTEVEKKELRQWYLKITAYAEKLLAGLENLPEWPDAVKLQQKNWIGKSTGAEIDFEIAGSQNNFVILPGWESNEDNHFYPWLSEKLGGRTVVYKNVVENPEEEILSDLEARVDLNENSVLIGHSLGGALAMKLLERSHTKIAKLVLVASFLKPKFKDKPRPFETKLSWNWDFDAIKNNAREILILSDETDPTVPEDSAVELSEKLNAPLIRFRASAPHAKGKEEPEVLAAAKSSIKVFTTRPDTIFGATYLVVAPEHPLLPSLAAQVENWDEVSAYVDKAKSEQEQQRLAEDKDKTGVELKGVRAINPATKEEIPIWTADYVLGNYGTGAIMAVPAHDERDYEFAAKFNLPIKQVVAPEFVGTNTPPREGFPTVPRDAAVCILVNPKTQQVACLQWAVSDVWKTFITGGIEPGEDVATAGAREITEETGYKNVKFVKELDYRVNEHFFHLTKNENRYARFVGAVFELLDEDQNEIDEKEKNQHQVVWVDYDKVRDFIHVESFRHMWDMWLNGGGEAYTGPGVLINSGEFDGMKTEEGIEKLGAHFGRLAVKYKLRDWVFSRQRYWGEPIPLVHCDKCGVVPVRDEDLPVVLPEVEKYEPTGTGESPLAAIDEWVNTACPNCDGPARRETNTMPQWAGSSWYYLRYTDPQNDQEFAAPNRLQKWLPVDVYFGGMEHTTLHLLYSRFWHLALFDQKLVPTSEPYTKRVPHGIVLASDGEKMSKSRGNVVNPDEIVASDGADTLRMYELFLGPHDAAVSWNDQGIVGVRRFYERIWKWVHDVANSPAAADSDTALREMNQLVKKVGDDIESFRFNTAVSAFMNFHNKVKDEAVTAELVKKFLIVLYPFAPHICEELNEILGGTESLQGAAWPEYDAGLLAVDTWQIVVQVNGKVKDKFSVPAGTTDEVVRQQAVNLPKVAAALGGHEPSRVVSVPGKLINLVM